MGLWQAARTGLSMPLSGGYWGSGPCLDECKWYNYLIVSIVANISSYHTITLLELYYCSSERERASERDSTYCFMEVTGTVYTNLDCTHKY